MQKTQERLKAEIKESEKIEEVEKKERSKLLREKKKKKSSSRKSTWMKS